MTLFGMDVTEDQKRKRYSKFLKEFHLKQVIKIVRDSY